MPPTHRCDIEVYRRASDRSARDHDYKYARRRAGLNTRGGREHAYKRVELLIALGLDRPRNPPEETDLAAKFNALADRWRRETRFSSSSEERVLHDAYQSIIAMGQQAVPLVLKELEKNGGHWFWALRFLTGVNPVPEGANIEAARKAWIEWGREHAYLK
jgi:hypothetical protein